MLVQAAILSLAQQCAPDVAPHTMDTLVQSESSGNPYAIGVVDMTLVEQPKTREEAIATAKSLIAQGARISGGLGQVYMGNWSKLGLTVETVFDPCPNLKAAASVLKVCYAKSAKEMGEGQPALAAAFSCYYSNNPKRGFVKEGPKSPSYVMRIAQKSEELKGVPPVQFRPSDITEVPHNDQAVKPSADASVQAIEDFSEKPKPKAEVKTQPEAEQQTQEQNTTEAEKPEPADDPMSWDVLGDFK
ncbi:transglycosylase SLT domain-containing protein [Pseudomonas syringae pv. coryli]|uniref:lytic transglycosylase domain-containing protein n=1 Tax=Pseudomonas syringae pv. coryli TaxID=317659 RepID=UPI003D271977